MSLPRPVYVQFTKKMKKLVAEMASQKPMSISAANAVSRWERAFVIGNKPFKAQKKDLCEAFSRVAPLVGLVDDQTETGCWTLEKNKDWVREWQQAQQALKDIKDAHDHKE